MADGCKSSFVGHWALVMSAWWSFVGGWLLLVCWSWLVVDRVAGWWLLVIGGCWSMVICRWLLEAGRQLLVVESKW